MQGSRGLSSILFVAFILLIPGIVQANPLGESSTLLGQSHSYAIDSGSSGIQWKSDDLFYGTPTLAADGTTYVLVAEVDNNDMKKSVALRALDPSGGKKWETPINGASTDPVVDREGNIYLVLQAYDISNKTDSRLVSFDPQGGIRWILNLSVLISSNEAAMGTPVIHPDGDVLVPLFNPYNSMQSLSQLWSIDDEGKLLWTCDITGTIDGLYVGPSSDSTIYITSYRGVVHGINPNGTLAWSGKYYLNERAVFIGSPSVVGPDGALYMPVGLLDPDTEWRDYSLPTEIMVIDPSGSVLLRTSLFSDFEMVSDFTFGLTGVSSNGTILGYNGWGYGYDSYAVTDPSDYSIPSRAFAISPQGDIIWSYELPTDEVYYSPPMLAEATLYLFTQNSTGVGKIVALQTNDGILLGTYWAPNKLWLSGQATGSNDRFLYLEGTFRGAEEGIITLVSTIGLPQAPVERPLDLAAATLAWGSIFGLMVGGGYYATHKKRI